MYRRVGYGTLFQNGWTATAKPATAATATAPRMRVSYIAYHFDTLERVEEEAKKSAMCTHNHIEGRQGGDGDGGADLSRFAGRAQKGPREVFSQGVRVPGPQAAVGLPAEGQVRTPRPRARCQLAFRCFLESEDWESCIRNVFSVKCDTDTVACIAGGIAEAYYRRTVPNEQELLKQYLIQPNELGEFDRFLYEWAVR